MSTTFTIAKREFRSYFDSPVAYVVICLSLLALGVLFFNFRGGFWVPNRVSIQRLFEHLPYLLWLLVIPVVTMRLLAEEKRSGTLEMLITLPVKDSEVILGKFLGAWGLVLVLILCTALFPLMMFVSPWNLGALDFGPVASGYLGLALYSAAAVALGLLVSALTESQIIALFVTFMVLAFLHLVGLSTSLTMLPKQAEYVVSFISFDMRLASFMRGLINTRDVIFFVSVTFGCLIGAFWALERRKWN